MKSCRCFFVLLSLLILLAACQPETSPSHPLTSTPTKDSVQPATNTPIMPEPTETATITSTATLQPTNTLTPVPTLNIYVSEQAGPMYELIFSIPVGEGGIRYRGVGMEDMETTGPNALAALPDGRFIIADLLDNRLLYYTPDGQFEKAVDLHDLDIVNVSDLQVAASWLFIKEVSFDTSPIRYRVNKLSLEGGLIASYDIPEEYRLADNLPGMTVDGDGRLLLDVEMFGFSPELNGQLPGNVIQLVDPQSNWTPMAIDGITFYDITFRHHPTTFSENRAVVIAGDVHVETQLTFGLGSLRLLGVLPDGRFFLIREDLVADYPVIQVDQTVHFISSDGEQLGTARYPLTERLYHTERGITLHPDGTIYALLPRKTSLDLIRLNFFTHLDPLIDDAVEPVVILETP